MCSDARNAPVIHGDAAGPELRRAMASLLGAILLAGGTFAAEAFGTNQAALRALSLEELSTIKVQIVYSASKYEQTVTEAPSAVSIVTADAIKHFGYRTLADVLRSVRGFDMTYDRNYGYVGVRGFNRPGDFGGRVLLQIDGHRLNEPLYDSAFNATDFILDLDLVDRIEIIRGPGSSIHGNNAFFGIINVVTRRGREVQGTEVSASAGSFDSYQGRLSYGNKFTNGVEMLFSGTLYNSEGQDRLFYPEFNNRADHHGIARRRDGDRFQSAFGSLAYHDFSIEGGHVARDKQIPTASYGVVFNDSRAHSVDKRSFVSLKYHHDFPGDWNLHARLYGDYYEFGQPFPSDTAEPGDPRLIILNKDTGQAYWWGGELQASKLILDRHRVMLGAEVRDNISVRQRNFDVAPRAVYLDVETASGSEGVFAQTDVFIVTNLSVNAGVRYDHYGTIGDTVNPRAAAIGTPWNGTTVKLIYGEAYRAPNDNELYYASPYAKANSALRPETIRSYELVLEQKLGRHLRASASLFQNDIDDLITQELDPRDQLLVYRNTSAVRARGVELELDGEWNSGLRGSVSYSLQRAENRDNDERLSNSPAQLAKLNLSVPIYQRKVFAGLEIQYVGDRLTLRREPAGDFALVNFTLFSRDLVGGLEASASIYNLFDTVYADPGAGEHVQDRIEQDGRSFRVKLTYRF